MLVLVGWNFESLRTEIPAGLLGQQTSSFTIRS